MDAGSSVRRIQLADIRVRRLDIYVRKPDIRTCEARFGRGLAAVWPQILRWGSNQFLASSMLLRYIEDFQRLNTNSPNGKSRPYKPALLLAVMDGIEMGLVQNRRVYITAELIVTFRKQLSALGATSPYQARHFAYPFYHLQSEDFWRLVEKPDKKIVVTAANSISGLGRLREAVDYALLDVSLWSLLTQDKTRAQLRDVLLKKYTTDVNHRAAH